MNWQSKRYCQNTWNDTCLLRDYCVNPLTEKIISSNKILSQHVSFKNYQKNNVQNFHVEIMIVEGDVVS
jgi:hypothetical protein